MKIRVSQDPLSITQKPKKGTEQAEITSRLSATDVTVEELAQGCVNGHTFAPGIFENNTRRNTHWQEQQVIALDFDGDFSMSEFNRRLLMWPINPAFIYTTFSHTEKTPKFRSVFICDEVINDYRLRNLVTGIMLDIFPEADKKCRDAAHMFYPGLSLRSEQYDQTIDCLDLIEEWNAAKCINDSFCHSKRDLETFANKYQVKLINQNLVSSMNRIQDIVNRIGVKTCPSNIYKVGTKIRQFRNFSLSDNSQDSVCDLGILFAVSEEEAKQGSQLPSRLDHFSVPRNQTQEFKADDRKQLLVRCRLLQEFDSSTRKLSYSERYLLLLNLLHLKGGEKWFHDMLSRMPGTSADRQRKARADAKYAISQGYKPVGCDNGDCPYASECEHKKNLLQQIDLKRGHCRKIADLPTRVSLDEARAELHEAITRAWNAEDTQIHVIRCDVGVGKTEELLSLPLRNAWVAFPTHKLKKEAFDRAIAIGVIQDIYYQPQRPRLPEHLQKQIDRLEKLRLTGKIDDIVDKYLETCEYPGIISEIDTFKEARKALHYQRIIFATHDKSLITDNPNIETCIFDEDLTDSLLKVTTVKVNDLNTIIAHCTDDDLKLFLRTFTELPHQSILTLADNTQFADPMTSLIAQNERLIDTPVIALLSEGIIIRTLNEIAIVEGRNLDMKKKHIILSATADESIYRALFGDRVTFYNCKPVETKGKLIIHPQHTNSRSNIEARKEDFFKWVIVEQTEKKFDGVITFKDLTEEVDGKLYLINTNQTVQAFATFGALEGLDAFKGKNIAIIGTPHLPQHIYRLIGARIGVDIPADTQPRNEEVTRNGYEFTFYCYGDTPALYAIQLYMIEQELIQAVGRARLVSTNAEVHLYSNFPLPYSVTQGE